MDFDFDDILKQFGVSSDDPPGGEPFEEEWSFEQVEYAGEEEYAEPAQEPFENEPDAEAPAGPEPDFDPEDPFAAWSAAERASSAAREAKRKASSAGNDEFHFEWPDQDSGRKREQKRLEQEREQAREEQRLAEERERAREQERLEQERERAREAQRLAEERERAKEQKRLEQERARAREQKRLEQERREQERLAAEREQAALRKRRAEEKENARLEKERASGARRRSREEEQDAAKASRKAGRREAPDARDVSREARPRVREEARETRRRAEEAPSRRREQEHRQGWIALVILLIVLLLAGGGVIYAGRAVTNSDKNLPNVYVGDIAVGKMTREETRTALLAGGWQERAATPLTVKTYNDLSVEIDPTLAGTVMTFENAVDAACSYGHDGNIFENFIAYAESIFGHTDVNRENASLNTAYLQQKVSELENMLSESLGGEPYTVDIPGEKLVVTKGQGSMKLDTHSLLQEVIAAVQNGKSELTFTMLSAQPVMPAFDAIYTELAAEPADARYSDDGKFTVIPETVGIWYDVESAKVAWQQAKPAETITIPVKVTYPAVTGEFLEGQLYHDLLGAMTTKYTNSGPNRCSNVRLATSKINGTILYPGDVISYNDTVGARTEAAGFLPAPAYTGLGEDGVKDEIGGGACQVSSTLYCASIYAFLETVERTAHIYPVNYIQVGTDATVTIPEDGGNVMDLKFRNSKNYPIKIVGYTEETDELKTITFEIWGTLEENDYMPVEFDNTYYWMLDYDRVIEPSHPDRTGYKIKFTVERYGFEDALGSGTRTLTHREVYDHDTGELVRDEIINPQIASGYAMDTYYNHG